jgi:hypothetical protein
MHSWPERSLHAPDPPDFTIAHIETVMPGPKHNLVANTRRENWRRGA